MTAITFQSSNIGGGANPQITKPAAWQVGDVFIAVICCFSTGTTGPAGWTKDWEGSLSEGGNTMGITIWSHIVDGTEGGSFQWTQSQICVGAIVCYRYASNPIVYDPNSATFHGNVSTNPSDPGVTTLKDGTMALAILFTNTLNANQVSVPWTERAKGNRSDTGTVPVSEKLMTTAGATGSADWTDANNSKWSSVVIGLAPLNTAPNTPTLDAPATNAYIDNTVVLKATATDPDNDNWTSVWEYQKDGGSWVSIGDGSTVASGAQSTKTWDTRALGPSGTYKVRVKARDTGSLESAFATSGNLTISHFGVITD